MLCFCFFIIFLLLFNVLIGDFVCFVFVCVFFVGLFICSFVFDFVFLCCCLFWICLGFFFTFFTVFLQLRN